MFRRILVATDLTAQASVALRLARVQAATHGAAIVVAHVLSMPAELRRWGGQLFRDDTKTYDALLERQRGAAEQTLARQVAAAKLVSPRGVRLVVRTGNPPEVLAALVDEVDADLVIVARGRGGKLGPVAEQLVRLVGRTVMVAPVKLPPSIARGIPQPVAKPTRRRRAAA
ncbi:MAG: universal stress protein [Kofleriaceae bacterium]